ncbi:MAG: DoxX family protein [Flavobacteriales bacterium]|nr:DoxX family protein [Flavobacteriales bacterium]
MKNKWINNGLKILFILCILPPTFGKITQNEQFLESFTGLGYPIYLTYILLVFYLPGIIALFQSKFLLLREWAYAGFTFALIGASLSHFLSGEISNGFFPLIGLLVLLSTYILGKKLKSVV